MYCDLCQIDLNDVVISSVIPAVFLRFVLRANINFGQLCRQKLGINTTLCVCICSYVSVII